MNTLSIQILRVVTLGFLFSSTCVMAVQPVQTSPAQFSITAPIEKFTLDTCTPPPSALINQTSYAAVAVGNALTCTATIVLNGQAVILPANTVITFPASFLTPYEAFAYNPLCTNGSCAETGLAIQDNKRLPDNAKPASYEATVQGNVVYGADGVGKYIAGLVSISQQDLNTAEGFINFIDYTTGELRVGGNIGDSSTGARVRINDPKGRFGRSTGPLGKTLIAGQLVDTHDSQDPRFAVDDGNPTIFAETGYPLCIPRTDPASANPDSLCPEFNRPVDTARTVAGIPMHIGSFSMPPAPAEPALGLSAVVDPFIAQPANFPARHNAGNPRYQAPLEVGDYIVYAGTQAVDNNGIYLSAHTITANLGIYTTPGTDPAYVTQEVTLVGVGTAETVTAPAEGRELFKVVGFSTDIARPVDTGKVQTDPCNGEEGFARITTDFPNGSSLDATGQAILKSPLGRFRSEALRGTALGMPMIPATKELRSQIQGATQSLTPNGLLAGQYTAPVSEYIFAENLGFGGLPIVPNNFEDFSFLTLGHGPYDLYDPYSEPPYGFGFVTSPLRGQLTPWPGLPTASVNCAGGGAAPFVIVVGDLVVGSEANFSLNATASYSPSGTALDTASWTQTAGPSLSKTAGLLGNSLSLNLKAPKVTGTIPTVLAFELTITDVNGRVSNKTVNVTVNPSSVSSDIISIPAIPTYRIKDGSWNISVTGTNAAAIVSVEAYDGTGKVVLTKRAMTQVNGIAAWNYTAKGIIKPTPSVMTVKFTSSKGGFAGPTAVSIRTR